VIVITNTGGAAEEKNIWPEVKALFDRLSDEFSGIADPFLPNEIGRVGGK
jgi:hypothetical protein